eukprot:6487917-Amphidinium_carterae.1
MTSTQAAQALHAFLSASGSEVPGEYGTHSCKVTWLSWLAKAGVPMDTRAVLGGHISPGLVSVFTYSRDELAQPMRAIEALATQIRLKQFDPDATRSGRWLSPVVRQDDLATTTEGEQPGHEEVLSSSSSTASESEEAEEVDKRLVPDAQVAVHMRTESARSTMRKVLSRLVRGRACASDASSEATQ